MTWLIKAIGFAAMAGFSYFFVQMTLNAKPGKRVSVWWGAWLLNPDYLEKEGLIYRKKMVISWLCMLLTSVLIHFLHIH